MMRTRSNSKRRKQSPGTNAEGVVGSSSHIDSERQSGLSLEENETLENISRDSVGKLIKKAKSRGGSRFSNADDTYLRRCDSTGKNSSESPCKEKQTTRTAFDATSDGMSIGQNTPQKMEVGGRNTHHLNPEIEDDDDLDWEDGSIPNLNSETNGVRVEFEVPEDASKRRKTARRATAEEKDLAELIHKVHLLCLLGRGRLIDCACNDPLIQASLLSLLPTHVLKIPDSTNHAAKSLFSIVNWFHKHFRVRSSSATKESVHLAMRSTLASQEGSPEVVTALFVALIRALNITARFVCMLDVAHLKPSMDEPDLSRRTDNDIFKASTLMFPSSKQTPTDGNKPKGRKPLGKTSKSSDSSLTDTSKHRMLDKSELEVQNDSSEACPTHRGKSKRKGDLEFELQLEMALSATAVERSKETSVPNMVDAQNTSSSNLSPHKTMKKIIAEGSHGISTAIGSKKVGAPLYWAEVYCSSENLTGKWVHVDPVNAIIDGEQNVEASAAACKVPLRYVVAFVGNGAKDVTRRVNSLWWDAVLEPLKKLEAGGASGNETIEAVKGVCHSEAFKECSNERRSSQSASVASSVVGASRSDLEDIELETKALTEPLPTNQQAYRTHHIYAIEKWLNKYQMLHPKGPVLGFCSGHPVYPRTCVQTLHTKQRWLREGLQVKANELPAKVLKHSQKQRKAVVVDDDESGEGDSGRTTALYGQWQTEPLYLPPAVNGIVPKNERGQVDVWSEKCLPPGTVHLPFPRISLVAKRLEIDYAPAMVGFDFRNGRSVPLFEGIVVCAEFKDAILEAHGEEEERRKAEERRRREAQALSKWYQLLSSIVTRQRLNNAYASGGPSGAQNPSESSTMSMKTTSVRPHERKQEKMEKKLPLLASKEEEDQHEHEHVFFLEDDDDDDGTRMKRCRCGFSIQFEEL
ncbi:hypothetical protein DM860_016266 [Cuscuta australis]|uniref:Rad4 beta-hairpin domain-containing protein n=1 Tax=Cuscuta australis TaxID=267555 RepID=A0A328E975_9ASTE|nr:hypothetical protein DM860_016266 [Cuscuta australis]